MVLSVKMPWRMTRMVLFFFQSEMIEATEMKLILPRFAVAACAVHLLMHNISTLEAEELQQLHRVPLWFSHNSHRRLNKQYYLMSLLYQAATGVPHPSSCPHVALYGRSVHILRWTLRQNYMKWQCSHFTLWPPRSPALHPAEHLSDELEQNVHVDEDQPVEAMKS